MHHARAAGVGVVAAEGAPPALHAGDELLDRYRLVRGGREREALEPQPDVQVVPGIEVRRDAFREEGDDVVRVGAGAAPVEAEPVLVAREAVSLGEAVANRTFRLRCDAPLSRLVRAVTLRCRARWN